MNGIKTAWADDSISDVVMHGTRRALSGVVVALRVTLYAVLAVLRPFIVVALSAVTLIGLAATLFYAVLVPGSHFPTGLVLVMSAASAVMIVLFYALMELLLPQ